MMLKFNISLDSSCKTSVMWDIHQHKISWFCNNHWSHSTQNTTTMFFQANHSMLYKEVDVITWLENIVWCELNINKCMYMHLLSKLQTQMTTLDLLKERLNTVRAKAVLWWEFIIIYCEFNNVFCDVSSHERINVSHFWLSDATTTSEDKSKKSEYLKS
jgi:hypothetical protein